LRELLHILARPYVHSNPVRRRPTCQRDRRRHFGRLPPASVQCNRSRMLQDRPGHLPWIPTGGKLLDEGPVSGTSSPFRQSFQRRWATSTSHTARLWLWVLVCSSWLRKEIPKKPACKNSCLWQLPLKGEISDAIAIARVWDSQRQQGIWGINSENRELDGKKERAKQVTTTTQHEARARRGRLATSAQEDLDSERFSH
jgi:hypothetical protein